MQAKRMRPTMTDELRFAYDVAFSRNRGLISREEQQRLRSATVAICGTGGVGGGHAITLARQGVGGFHLADPDTFAPANLNRQAGARMSSMGMNKAAEIGRMIIDINPDARVTVFEEAIGPTNIGRFLDGVGCVLDGVDFFAMGARRLLFATARERGLWTLTAGPLGFSSALIAFAPDGMSFDEYCDLNPGMSEVDQLVAFAVAVAPAATQFSYMDYSEVDLEKRIGPSAGLACQLCSALISMEAIAILLGRRRPRAAPAFSQFDAYRGIYKKGRLRFGNRGPLQLLKRYLLRRRFAPRP